MQDSLRVSKRYSNYPLMISGRVDKVYEQDDQYLFDIEPLYESYGIIEKCYLFYFLKPKENDIVAVTFLNNYTMPAIIGVCQQPEKFKTDQDYKVEHPSGSSYTLKANGDVEVSDKHGNALVMDKDGVKVNGHYLVTKEFLDAMLKTDAANLGMGNLTAPVPVNPLTLAKWLPNITTIPDEFLTNKTPITGA